MGQAGYRVHVAAALPPTGSSAIIAPHIIRYLLLVADENGVSLDRSLRAAGLSRETLHSTALRVSYRQGRAVIEAALDAVQIPALGIVVGGRQPITASGLLGLAMMSSPTIAEAVDLGISYQNLAGSMVRWSAHVEHDELVVVATVPDNRSRVDRFLIEEAFASITRMARDTTVQEFRPTRVEFVRDRPADAAPFSQYFGGHISFGAPRNAWHMPIEYSQRPLGTGDPWTLAEAVSILNERTRETIERQELVAVLAARVEDALPALLPLRAHAQGLATSERTLRRRLADVDAGYADIVEDVRRRLAGQLITRTELPFADIAFRLGYADERSLRRSVHRWFGTSPTELRVS